MFGDKPDRDSWGQPWQRASTTDLDHLVDVAVQEATRAANADKKVVFCPPVCTLVAPTGYGGFAESDLAEGVSISIDLDEVPPTAAKRLLSGILNREPTVTVHTGGIFQDEHGVQEDRLHLHWRLMEPARTKEDHALLKECRDLASRIVKTLT
jgi:hypothetical protein